MNAETIDGSRIKKGATMSPCGRYRYLLYRIWDETMGTVNFIGLNPSTADGEVDDPTIRRMIGFSQLWGYGGIVVTNLFALISTDPVGLKSITDPIGPMNDFHLEDQAMRADKVIVCWGADACAPGRVWQIKSLLSRYDLWTLGLTKHGAPRHPLYLKQSTTLIRFR